MVAKRSAFGIALIIQQRLGVQPTAQGVEGLKGSRIATTGAVLGEYSYNQCLRLHLEKQWQLQLRFSLQVCI